MGLEGLDRIGIWTKTKVISMVDTADATDIEVDERVMVTALYLSVFLQIVARLPYNSCLEYARWDKKSLLFWNCVPNLAFRSEIRRIFL